MGEYQDIEGLQTWVDKRGRPMRGSEVVLLLHGGLSNSDLLLDMVTPALSEEYSLVGFDRRGHGRTADTPAPFHYADMGTETIDVLDQVIGGSAHLVGFSDGGIVAMLVALRRPELVRRLVLIGANFHHLGVRQLDLHDGAPLLSRIATSYAERSPDGPDHFGAVAEKSQAMFLSEPTLTTADVSRITAPTLVLVGDDDLVELSHTCALYEALPAGQLAVVPGASHLVVLEKPAEVIRIVAQFLSGPTPPETLMPIGRAGGMMSRAS